MNSAMDVLHADRSIKCGACHQSTLDQHGRNATFEDEDRLLAHIAVEHVFWIPFQCILCPMICSTETVLKIHYIQAHPGSVPKAIYTYREEKKIEMYRILEWSRALQSKSNFDTDKCQNWQRSHAPSQISIDNSRFSLTSWTPAELNQPLPNAGTPHQESCQENPPLTFQNRADSEFCTRTLEQSRPSVPVENVASAQETKRELAATPEPEVIPIDQQQPQVDPSKQQIQQCIADMGTLAASLEAENQSKNDTTTKAESSLETDSKDQDANPFSCRLCTDQIGSVSKAVRQAHIWRRHMPRAPVQCRICGWRQFRYFTGAQRKHLSTMHPEVKGEQLEKHFKDYRQKLADRFQRKFDKAFTDIPPPLAQLATTADQGSESQEKMNEQYVSATAEQADDAIENTPTNTAFEEAPTEAETNSQKKLIECRLCQVLLKNNKGYSKTAHIWACHVERKRYQCTLCTYSASNLYQISKVHSAKAHGRKKGVTWTNNTTKLEADFKDAFQRAFGTEDGNEGSKVVSKPTTRSATKANNSPTLQRFDQSASQEANSESHEMEVEAEDLMRTAAIEAGLVSELEPPLILKVRKNKIAERRKTLPIFTPKPKEELTTKGMSRCALCEQLIANRSKDTHVWTKHMQRQRYTCTLCDYTTGQRRVAEMHVQHRHSRDNADDFLIDQHKQVAEEYVTVLTAAFGDGQAKQS